MTGEGMHLMGFDLKVHRSEQRVELALTGDFDIAAAPAVEAELRNIEAMQPRELVFDLRGLDFMDSTGLRLVVTADLRAREEERRVILVRGGPSIHRLFRVTGLEPRLTFVEDLPA